MTFIGTNTTRSILLDHTQFTPASGAPWMLDHLANTYDAACDTFWSMAQLHDGPARVTPGLLHDVLGVHEIVRTLRREQIDRGDAPVKYFVCGSNIQGVYNLGGDLALFADRIRQRDDVTLRAYAHLCIDVIYNNHVAFDLPIVTIGLVQGDALGGGFECALSYDVLIAERNARLGLPEVLFNLFPGMGAYSFLSRRVGSAKAEQIILSGRIHTGAELHAMGVVDVLAEDGEGVQAARDYVSRQRRRFNAHRAVLQARHRVHPVTEQELRDVVEIWVDAAMRLEEPDLRKMERLVTAQRRHHAAALQGA